MVGKLTKKGDHSKTESQRGTLNRPLYLLSCCYDRIPDERRLKKEGCVLVQSLRLQADRAGKSWQQEFKAAGHSRRQRAM